MQIRNMICKPGASTSSNQPGANYCTDLTHGDMLGCAARHSRRTLHQQKLEEQLHKVYKQQTCYCYYSCLQELS